MRQSLAAFSIAFLLLTSCRREAPPELRGHLIYSLGVVVQQLDLRELRSKEIVRFSNTTFVEEIAALDADTLLIGTSTVYPAAWSLATLALSDSRITSLGREAKNFGFARECSMLLYQAILSGEKNVLVTERLVSKRDGSRFLYGLEGSQTLVARASYPDTSPIAASGCRFFFATRDEKLMLFDGRLRKLEDAGVRGCVPVLWRSATGELLCKKSGETRLYLLELETRKEREIKDLEGSWGFAYSLSQDTLFFTLDHFTLSHPEVPFIHSYDFKRGVSSKLREHDGMHAAIWIDAEDVALPSRP